jgi:hypothetical protein
MVDKKSNLHAMVLGFIKEEEPEDWVSEEFPGKEGEELPGG